MTVAAAIETGSGGILAPGLNKAQGAAQGSRLATVANQGFLQPIASGTESFRTGWKSLLASLGSEREGPSETEAEADHGIISAEPVLADAMRKDSMAASTPVAAASSRASQETEKGTGPVSERLKLAQADARAASSAVRSAADSIRSSTEKRRTSANQESQSTGGSRPFHSVTGCESKVAAAGVLPELVPAALAAVPQAVAVAGSANPVTHDVGMTAQSALERGPTETLAELFVDPSTGFASDYFSSRSQNMDTVGGSSSASPQDAASETKISDAAKGAALLVGPHAEGVNTPASSLVPTPAEAPNLPGRAPQESDQLQPFTSSISLAKPLPASSALSQMHAAGQPEIAIQLGATPLPVAMDRDSLNAMPAAASANASASGQRSVVSRSQGNPGPSDGKKNSDSNAVRTPRESSSAGSAQHGNHFMPVQSSGSAADASAVLHSITGAGGAASTSSESTVRISATTTGPDSREAFTTLDAGEATGKATWIHAGAQRAEAGFQDPALGWVGVRADSSGGAVRAELVAGSAEAAQTLGGHLAGLNAYLVEHHTPVETLTLSSPASGWTALGNGQGSGDGMQQGPEHQTGQETTQTTESGVRFAPSTTPELPVLSARRDGDALAGRMEGNHISVIA